MIISAESIVHVTQIEHEIMKHVNVSQDYSWNPSTFICENGKYLKSIPNVSKIVCDEIINTIDNVSKICQKIFITRKMDRYSPHTVLLPIIPLFMIVIICYHYAKDRSKLNKNNILSYYKSRNGE